MPRRRLGVALLFAAEVAAELDGLRRALGEPERERIAPHVTLVPPVNVREESVGDAGDVLRAAAASCGGALRLTIGPPATFLPDNPVVYLRVGGEGLSELHALRDAVFVPPLSRPLSWPFVPHVTLADGIDPPMVASAADVLHSYTLDVVVHEVTLLEERDGHRWTPIASASLGPAVVVGRGGLPLDLSVTERLDDDVRAWLSSSWADPQRALAVTARRDGLVVGTAAGWTDGLLANLSELFVAVDVRGQGVGGHVVAAFVSAAAERGCVRCRLRCAAGGDAERFYADRGWRREAVYPGAADGSGADIAQLLREL